MTTLSPTSNDSADRRTLPIFRLAFVPQPSLERLDNLAKGLLGIDNYSLQEVNGRRMLRSKTRLIEVDNEKGAVWAADQAELWNPRAKPQLPNMERAQEIADEFMKKNALLPSQELDGLFVVEPLGPAGSYISILDKNTGEREKSQLDYRVRYNIRMIVKDPETGSELKVPVISGMGKFAVTIGDAGRVIAYNSTWLPIDAIETHAVYIPRNVADQRFKKLTSKLNIESFDADLAYAFAQSPGKKSSYLYPVWTYRATGNIKGHKFPLRIIIIPATEFGPQSLPYEPQPRRTKRMIPRSWETVKRRGLRSINPYEGATSWIGEIGGLGGSKNNAQGFVDGLRDAGWNVNFNWGDCNAWESDWHENDDYYVDAADFVFYTGHAYLDGWNLVNPADCSADFLTSPEPGGPPDRWGRQDLEWFIVAACGPLQDDILAAGGGDVLERWRGSFDGMHILMGYGAITFDNEEEGQRVIQYAREGQTIVNAWFRTAQEIQPSDNGAGAPDGPIVYVGAMWVGKSGESDPVNDHIWGYGSVAPDPKNFDFLACMWVPC
jgi:hypothetical protein